MLVVLENTYLEEMVGNRFTHFCILEKNPFLVKLFTPDLVNSLHLPSNDKVFIIHS